MAGELRLGRREERRGTEVTQVRGSPAWWSSSSRPSLPGQRRRRAAAAVSSRRNDWGGENDWRENRVSRVSASSVVWVYLVIIFWIWTCRLLDLDELSAACALTRTLLVFFDLDL